MKKKTKLKSFLAVFLLLVLVVGWYISIFGIGKKVDKISDQLKYGLDINGGVYVLLEADIKESGTERAKIMEQTKTVLENRVNAMGISEASVSIEGNNRIRIEMPGVENADEAIEQVGKTAQLRFLLADGTEVMTGDAIKDASSTTDTENGGYKITMDFTGEGADLFAAATEKAASGDVKSFNSEYIQNNAIIIMLDDEIVSAPSVKEKISSRSCEITSPNGFSEEEASSTAALIRGGALPASLTEVNSSVETATIGADALTKSVKAGIIGLAIVMLLMIIVYGALGVVADIALLIYIQLILWGMAGIGIVLTLPGIAGIILSIGMAVDSNVIIFTRIREEIAKGKSVRVAVDQGFQSAFTTVIDAQTTTLIASIVLYLIGTTSVKGFAITLMIGTVCSIITAVFITQLYIQLMADSKTFSQMKFFGMKEDGSPKITLKKSFNFIKNRKKFYAISACVLIIGLGFGIFRGFNYGIDFTGGTMIQIDMGKQVSTEKVEKTIASYKLNPTIVYAGDDNSQIIIRTTKDLKATERAEVEDKIIDEFKLDKDTSVLSSEEFGPSVGKDLRKNAVKSILIAGLCMLIYIRFRFKTWKYGLAAITGLVHDVFITLSLYAIFGFTINNPFIAGILTVVGYSINDTIVVFDRIRENVKFFKRKQNEELIDSSINQTLSRSIMTSVTTLIVMIPLFFMVNNEIRQFLIPLIIGVLVGTYSSIFLCSPVFYELTRKENLSRYEIEREKAMKKRRANGGIVK